MFKKTLLLIICCLLLTVYLPSVSIGANTPLTLSDITAAAGGGEGGLAIPIQIFFFLTILTLLPAVLLMMTSFTRFIIVFSLLRHALNLQQTPPNQVLIGMALFMTFFVMSPVFDQVYEKALAPYMAEELTQKDAFSKGLKPLREFMFRQTGEEELAFFVEMSKTERPKGYDDIPIRVIIPAFIISELKTAFQIGFVIFIPFLIIDMVVASILMSMGMLMLPPVLISLPFKLMLFVLVDGWSILVGSMVRSFSL